MSSLKATLDLLNHDILKKQIFQVKHHPKCPCEKDVLNGLQTHIYNCFFRKTFNFNVSGNIGLKLASYSIINLLERGVFNYKFLLDRRWGKARVEMLIDADEELTTHAEGPNAYFYDPKHVAVVVPCVQFPNNALFGTLKVTWRTARLKANAKKQRDEERRFSMF